MKREIDWFKFFIVLIITVAIFIIGVFFGSNITQMKFDTVVNTEQTLRLEVMGLDLQYSILEDDPCKVFNDTALSASLDEMGNKVTYLENVLGTSNIEVTNLKIYYSLLQIRHYLLKKKATHDCNFNNDFILYFYSNMPDCKDCKEQGFVLSNIREKYENLSIYSFDTHLENPAIDTLKSKYAVDGQLPVIIINGQVYRGFLSKDFITEKLYGR